MTADLVQPVDILTTSHNRAVLTVTTKRTVSQTNLLDQFSQYAIDFQIVHLEIAVCSDILAESSINSRRQVHSKKRKLRNQNLTTFEEFQSRKRKVSDSTSSCIMETFVANFDSVFGSMICHDISYHWGAAVVFPSYCILMS